MTQSGGLTLPGAQRPLRIVPLGGLGQIGKNILAIEYGDDIVVVDAGLGFPRGDPPGAEITLPDFTYLRERHQRVRAVLITHGHDDHIGALPYLLREMSVPVYAPPFAYDLVRTKLGEQQGAAHAHLRLVEPGVPLEVGPFSVDYLRVTHSIPDAYGLAIRTLAGVVFHTGDFKLDAAPVDGRTSELRRIARLGDAGVLLLLSDSTYAEVPGRTASDEAMPGALDGFLAGAPGRVIIATFASHMARVQQVVDAAVRHRRKVALVGRGMVENVQMAIGRGYVRVPTGVLVNPPALDGLPSGQQVLLVTGGQGEPTSVMGRMAARATRDPVVRPGDTVVLSASIIPGNEITVHRMVDNLVRLGARVYYDRNAFVHVHGHASQEELTEMLGLVRPRYFVPVHGDYRMLVAHAGLAEAAGVPHERIFVMEDGDTLEFGEQGAALGDRVPAGAVYVTGGRQITAASPVWRERRTLAREGVLAVAVTVHAATGAPAGAVHITSRGVLEEEDAAETLAAAADLAAQALQDEAGAVTEWEAVRAVVRRTVSEYVEERTGARPVILVTRVEV